MYDNYLKLRTVIVVVVVLIFAAALHPLVPRDFYMVFQQSLKSGAEEQGAALIEQARKSQEGRQDLYPSVALYDVVESTGVNLAEIVDAPVAQDNSEAISFLRKKASGSIRLGLDLAGGVEYIINLQPDYAVLADENISQVEAEKRLNDNFNQYRDLAMESLRKRLESQNILETEITPFGAHGLSVKAPLVSKDEKDKLQRLIQMSNKLEFRLVHPNSDQLLAQNVIPPGYEVLREESIKVGEEPPPVLVSRRVEMTGNGIDKAFASRDEFGRTKVAMRFNGEGTRKFAQITGNNVGRRLAIVLDGRLYSAPNINARIDGGNAEITGNFSVEEAQLIADALTSGSFPFRVDVEAVYDTDPTLGADNVRNGIWAGLGALALLGIFMIVYYRTAGFIAVIALAVNVILLLGTMAAFDATLTMPGIAGIILTLGMAIDANVLVFERMREEIDAGKPMREVIPLGFDKAYSSVMDGNLTTLIVAIVLMQFGTGAVKGFAVSLSIGIICSLFTALFMSRVIFDWLLHLNRIPKINMLRFFSKPNINFLKHAKKWAIASSLIAIAISIVACIWRGESMLSVDFTGGVLASYQYQKSVPTAQLENVISELGYTAKVTYKANASAADNRKLELLIRQGSDTISAGTDGIQSRLMNELNAQFPELQLSDGQATVVGGMVGMEMTKNAILSLLLSFVGMIVYVAFRYELNYAFAGILALAHDGIIALGIFVLLGRELSLPAVAGILTVIGYSINDTIVVFDRIREVLKLHPEKSFEDAMNDSLNRTLSRTILTSLTTLWVAVVMLIFGGLAINDFALIIALGIVIGSYSTLFIASPLLVAYNKIRKTTGRFHRANISN